MLCIGLEGTAHTLGIGLIDSGGKIYANVRSEYVPESGGIHPREAAQHHTNVFASTLRETLEKGNLNKKDIVLQGVMNKEQKEALQPEFVQLKNKENEYSVNFNIVISKVPENPEEDSMRHLDGSLSK